jgi:curli biogenesis system outer membrane secretion channel CsgG
MSNTKAGIALSDLASRIGGAGLQKNDGHAIVSVAVRMIDTSTAQILAAVTGNAEANESGASMVTAFAGGNGVRRKLPERHGGASG